MIALKRCKAKNVFAGKRSFSLSKDKKGEENVFVGSLDQCRRLLKSARKGKKCFCDEPSHIQRALME